jgi:hypothetical protein
MKYAVEKGSVVMKCIPSFKKKNWFRHSEVDGGDIQTAWISHKPTFIFSK